MAGEIEKEFLELRDFEAHTLPALPPAIGIEWREARCPNQHSGLMTAHRTPKYASDTPGMIGRADHNGRSKPAPVAPGRQQRTFVFGPVRCAGDRFDGLDVERVQKVNENRRSIVDMNAPTGELVVGGPRRLCQHRDAARNPRSHQIGGINRA